MHLFIWCNKFNIYSVHICVFNCHLISFPIITKIKFKLIMMNIKKKIFFFKWLKSVVEILTGWQLQHQAKAQLKREGEARPKKKKSQMRETISGSCGSDATAAVQQWYHVHQWKLFFIFFAVTAFYRWRRTLKVTYPRWKVDVGWPLTASVCKCDCAAKSNCLAWLRKKKPLQFLDRYFRI